MSNGLPGAASIADLPAFLGGLALLLILARLGAALMRRLGQPEVLGELLAGILIGNLGLAGIHALDHKLGLPALDLLAEIGVLFLLFRVGLESDLSKMIAVGRSSLLVAAAGVAASIVLGGVVSRLFHPHSPIPVHLFIGTTLCATSVGITARVLAERRQADTPVGRVILGAAVVDDVLALLLLSILSGWIGAAGGGARFDGGAVAWVALRALVFLAAAMLIGRALSRQAFRLAARIEAHGLLVGVALALLFGLAWLAAWMGLAPIIGAFAAGLVLEPAHYQALRARDTGRRDLDQWIEPIAAFLVPLFFVRMGMRVDLSVFRDPGVVAFALALTLAAVAAKLACALGVVGRGVDRLAVSFGMIPRGEVELIFAGIGSGLVLAGSPVIDTGARAAIVATVALTTVIGPPLLASRLRAKA
ncbi:MAG TPA: cation:proton antiporter [Candidatus Udaeobacter sp.]|jgi:Kef-type K+ transport system membrane component KefB|nr:cation:proton antiporter [Candidatus Udaeobacter sp.]